jgi:hypothetical protein
MTQIDEKASEAAAKAVFECHCFNPDKHPWIKGGNSFKQQDARRLAAAAIEAGRAALPPTGDVGLREAIDDCEEARKQRDVRDRFLVQRGLWGEFCKWLPDELPPVSAEARIAELERELSAERAKFKPDWANFREGVSVGEAAANARAKIGAEHG